MKPLSTSTDYRSEHLAIGLSRCTLAFTVFSVDSLGRGKVNCNPVMSQASDRRIPGLELKGDLTYTIRGHPVWRVTCEACSLTLRSELVVGMDVPSLTLRFNQKTNHATLLGMMDPGERRMSLPCVLHMPDMGSLRITCNTPGVKLDYDARRWVEPAPFVDIAFPPAKAGHPHVEYRMEVIAIHPPLSHHADNRFMMGFGATGSAYSRSIHACRCWRTIHPAMRVRLPFSNIPRLHSTRHRWLTDWPAST